MSKQALLIPADPTQPAKVIDLDSGPGELRNLQAAVGGLVEVQAHPEGDLWCNDSGRLDGLPINVRVSRWLIAQSTASQEGRFGEGMIVYGDVVVTGPPDREGDTTPVDPEMVSLFTSLTVSPDALRDWDTRNVDVVVTDWDV
jgi:hypothetical protein